MTLIKYRRKAHTDEGAAVTSEGAAVTSEGAAVTSEGAAVTSEGAAVTSPSHPAPPLFAHSRTSRARTLTRAACPAHTRRTIPRGVVRFPPSCSGRSRPTPRPSHPGRERRAPVSNAGIRKANRKPASCRRLVGAGSRAGVITRVKRGAQ